MTDKFKKCDCKGCYREYHCMVLHFMINYQKVGICPCSACLVKVVCKHNPCEDFGAFYREVWEVYMIAFDKQKKDSYYDK